MEEVYITLGSQDKSTWKPVAIFKDKDKAIRSDNGEFFAFKVRRARVEYLEEAYYAVGLEYK